MRLTIPLLLSVLIGLSVTAPAMAGRRVTVGIYQNPPLIFIDTKGQAQGIAVDILAHVARKEDWALQYLPGSWAQCTRRLETGVVDLLPGMARTRDGEGKFAFGKESLVADWGQLYIRSDAALGDLLDLEAKAVAVVETDAYYHFFETLLTTFDIHPRFVQVADYETALSLVHRKEASAGIVSRLYGGYYEKRLKVKKSPISFHPTELHFAVAGARNGDLLIALDNHLKRLKSNADSIFYRSLDQWTQGVREVSLPPWLVPLWVLGVIAVVMGLILGGNVILRRRVKLRTEALKRTIVEKERIESELTVARDIQLQLVPNNSQASPRRKEFAIFASLKPAREVGGDFYDYFFIDRNSLCLVIGDVSGKGVPAALFMAMTKTMLKSAARLLVDPEYILADVNREIARNNPSLTFVTVFLGVLDLNSGVLTYASAGHNPPLFIGRKGNAVLLSEAQGPAIGLDESVQFRQASARLRHNEGLLLFTDGVIEARNADNRLFTQEALINTVSLTAGLTPEARIRAILSQVDEFVGSRPLDDDLALMALTYFSPNRIEDPLTTVVLKNDLREMSRITDTIAHIADTVACPPVVVHDITLAMEEVFSNIVFYGFGDDLDHTITFHVAAEENALVLTLQDEGIPFNPLNVQVGPRDKPLEERDKGGMGIILAKNLMDKMEYRRERGKNILRLEKRFR